MSSMAFLNERNALAFCCDFGRHAVLPVSPFPSIGSPSLMAVQSCIPHDYPLPATGLTERQITRLIQDDQVDVEAIASPDCLIFPVWVVRLAILLFFLSSCVAAV